MASSHPHAEDDGRRGDTMLSPTRSTAEYEKSRLLDADFSSDTYAAASVPCTRSSSSYSTITLLLALSNVISILVLVFVVSTSHPGAEEPGDPGLVRYPSQPGWFPPQSRFYHRQARPQTPTERGFPSTDRDRAFSLRPQGFGVRREVFRDPGRGKRENVGQGAATYVERSFASVPSPYSSEQKPPGLNHEPLFWYFA